MYACKQYKFTAYVQSNLLAKSYLKYKLNPLKV
jgi:hypothetical protein